MRILIFLLGVILSFNSFGDDKLSVTNTSVESNTEFSFEVNLENSSPISAIQFDLDLDMTMFKLEDGSSLNSSRVDDHQLSLSKISDSKLRFIIFSSSNKNLVTGSGKLITVKLKSKYEPGSYSVNFSNIIASNASEESVSVTGESGSITLEAPKMVINTTSINFDRVPLGQTKNMSFTVYNQGNKELTITKIRDDISPFESVTSFPLTVSAGSSKNIELKFTSTTKGTYSSTLQIDSNEPNPNRANHKITLSAISFAVNELRIGNFNGYSNKPIEIIVKVNNMEKFTGFQFDLNLPHGFEYVSSSEKYLGRETNHQLGAAAGTNKITFIGYSSTNANFTGEDGNLFSFEIIANVQYGYYTLYMNNVILTDSTTQNILSDYYNGSVQIASPRMGLSTTNINFGNVDLTDSVTASIEVRNYGNDTLKVTSVNFESDEVSWDIESPFILLNWESKYGNFKFKPTNAGTHSSKVLINHNDPNKVSKINFSANVFSPNYFYIQSRTARVGESIDMPFSLRNNNEVTGFQFDIEEPDKLTFDLSNIALSSRKSDHTITYSKIADKKYRIICYSPTSKVFSGSDGEILYIPTQISSDITPTSVSFNLSNVLISDVNMTNVLSPTFSDGYLTIENNITPVTNDDAYSTNENTTLSVDKDSGILSNDSDGNNDVLEAILVSNVSNGTLSLSSDGSFEYVPDTDYSGNDSFTYKTNDGFENGNTATVYISVLKVAAPTGNDDNYSTNEEEVLTVNESNGVLTNDTDENTNILTAVLVSGVSNGSLSLNSNGSFSYTPNANYFGEDNFSYKPNNGTVDGNVTLVKITIINVNDAPVSSDVTVTTDEDTQKEITLSASDVDGDALVYSVVDQPSNGSVTISGSTATYKPASNYNGNDSFTYRVNDGTVNSNTATVSITVTPVNDAPVSSDINTTATEDTQKDITLSASDVEGSSLTYSIVSGTSNGTTSLSGNVVTYTPNTNYNGSDSFTYRVNDGTVNSNTATVSITITPVNDAPVSSDVSVTTDEDTQKDITLSTSDGDGDALVYSVVDQPSNGSVTISGSTATYIPTSNYNGNDSFTYKVNDGTVDGNTATVSITITPVNDAPKFTKNSYSFNISESDTVNTELFQVTASDAESDKLTYAMETSNVPFSVVDSTGILKLDSVLDYETKSSYSFTLTVSDGLKGDTATIGVTLKDEQPSISITPSSIDFGLTEVGLEYTKNISILNEGKDTLHIKKIESNLSSAITISLPEGDYILAGSGKSYEIKYNPTDIVKEEGFFTILNNSNAPDKKIYIQSEVLAENFIYFNSINPFPSEKDTLKFILKNPNSVIGFQLDIGISEGITYYFDSIYLSNRKSDHSISASLVEENKIRIISYSLSSSSFSGNDGILFYLPIEIPDTLKAKVYTLSALKTVISNVSGINIAKNLATIGTIKVGNFTPIASNDSYVTDEDITLTISATNGVLANDSDVENDSIGADLISDVSNGILTLNSEGSFEYIPDLNFFGSDSFTYKTSDVYGSSDSATVNLTITSVNDAPIGIADNYFVNEDNTLIANSVNNNVGVLSNDTDEENDTLTAVLVSNVSNGNLILSSDGTFQYTPNANYFGNDEFTYKANDKFLETDTTKVSISINSVNDEPVSSDISVTTDEDTQKEITLSASDVDGDALVYSVVDQPSNGSVTISGSTATYKPASNYNGNDSFTYRVYDGTVNSNTATVSITVTPIDDAPIALPDFYTTQENIPITIFSNVGIISNDIEVESQELTINLIDDVSHGLLNLEPDGSFEYTPATDYFGEDTFTYTISDGLLVSDTTTVTIEILETNYPPVTSDISRSTTEDTPVDIKLLATDQNDDNISFKINLNPSNGSLFINEDIVTYSPDADFYGVDSLKYYADDGRGGISNTSTVTITVDSVYDIPTVDISILDTLIYEYESTKMIATLQGVDAGDAEVNVPFTLSGTVSPDDYTISGNSINIPISSTEVEITITAVNDTENENDEVLVITFEGATNATYSGTNSLELTIKDDDLPLALENEELIKNIYPNPTSERVTIELRKNRKILGVRVHDFSGKIVKSVKGNNSSSFTLPLHGMGDGIYLLRVETDFENIVKKIIIDKK